MRITSDLKSKRKISDEKYILRCIQLAKNGLGTTFPNPMVGCVLVHNNKIIGEGYTSAYGGAHAEVNAINSVTNKSLLENTTLYVTLEPCSHYGKTPPCADLILKYKIPRIVIGTMDPNEKVSGRGIKKLRAEGCEVLVGVCEQESKNHHKRFLRFHQQKRPYIILKWAQTSDGFIAPDKGLRSNDPKPYWITNKNSRQLVHKWRSEEQAILVGTNTILEDNPKLDVRKWLGSSPTRMVLDKNLKIDANYHILDTSIKTIVFTEIKDRSKYTKGVIYEVVDFSNELLQRLCEIGYKHSILSILIEGGSKTIQSFIEKNLWDEARVFTGTSQFGNGLKAPRLSAKQVSSLQIGTDTLNIYKND
ncbi:MAG: bifunctional diaminohydroxyphosphoribosylaminopyrimidine deaminase/5-amino-6-(5-phosphoribosylamino)uracil reductase RibD [Flavobacteriaceae bacterium]